MEQNIYTYCFLRFNKPGGGFGVYSCSDGFAGCFENEEIRDAVATSFLAPINSSVWLSNGETDTALEEKRIDDFHPQKFGYQILKFNNREVAVLSYGKNLGRATVGLRPGNILIYTLAGSPKEVEDYPCFYAGDEDYLKFNRDYFMRDPDDPTKYQDLSGQNAKRAKKLHSKSIKPGNTITRESVHRFLIDEPGSADILTGLFYALISEHSGKKRPIIICDEKDKIMYWIAAVTMLFPLGIAKKISFSSYEFLGSRSSLLIPVNYQLCGVYSPTANGAPDEKATNYSYEMLKDNSDIVLFDIEKDVIPEYETDEFSEVIRKFCRGDESDLRQFHDYLLSETTYNDYGSVYTRFYPYNSVNDKLFRYYKKNTQESIVNEYYPFLYETDASDEDLQKAFDILFAANECRILNIEQLREDLTEFTKITIEDDTIDDLNYILRLDTVMKLVGLDSVKMIKDYVRKNGSNFLLEKNSVKKPGMILGLYNPNDLYTETEAVNNLIRSLINSEEGKDIISSTVKKWFENGFHSGKSILKPDSVIFLLRLDTKNCSNNIDYIIRETMYCDKKYQRDLLELLLRSEFSNEVFEKLQKYLWNGLYSYCDVYGYCTMLFSIDREIAEKLNESFMSRLRNETIQTQKEVFTQFISDPGFRINNFWNDMTGYIFRTYAFSSEDEVASFAYTYFMKAFAQNILNYNETSVVTALNRLSCSEKKWKKAVDRVISPAADSQLDMAVREKMKNVFKSGYGGSNYPQAEEKKGVFGSIFDSLKNNFRGRK